MAKKSLQQVSTHVLTMAANYAFVLLRREREREVDKGRGGDG